MLDKGKSNAQIYTVSTFVIPFYYGSGTVIIYGSGSAKVRNKITVTVPLRQNVTVPTLPVPQHS